MLVGVIQGQGFALDNIEQQVANYLAENPPVAGSEAGLFSDLGSLSIPASSTLIRTTGYSVAGLGAATYRVTATTGETLSRKQSADGRWWELHAEDQVLVTQFGAIGDGVNDDTAAIQAALRYQSRNVTRREYATSLRVILPTCTAFYLVTSDLVIDRNVIFEGAAPAGRGNTAVKIKFADTCDAGIWVKQPGLASAVAGYSPTPKAVTEATALGTISGSTLTLTGPVTGTVMAGQGVSGTGISSTVRITSGSGSTWTVTPGGHSVAETTLTFYSDFGSGRSTLRSFALEPVNPYGVRYGIVHNCPAMFEDIHVQYFENAGFFAHGQSSGTAAYGDHDGVNGNGTMYGNTNGSHYTRCIARDIEGGAGFAAQGNNTQIMLYDSCDATDCLVGFRDNSAIGNIFLNCHSAQCSYKVWRDPGTTLLTDGDFASGASWTPGTGWSIGAGVAVSTGGGNLDQTVSLSGSTLHCVVVEVTAFTSGNLRAQLVGGSTATVANWWQIDGDGKVSTTANGQAINGTGTWFTFLNSPSGGATTFRLDGATSPFVGTIDNVRTHQAQFYAPVGKHTAGSTTEPGVGANWREQWVPVTATVPEAKWVSGVSYPATGGINIIDTAGNNPQIISHYSEGGIEVGIVPRGNCTILGGTAAGYGRIYHIPNSDSSTVQVFGSGLQNTAARWQNPADSAGYTFGSSLGLSREAYSFFACGHSHADAVKTTNLVQLTYSLARNSFEWIYDGSTRMISYTGPGWTKGNLSGSGFLYAESKGLVIGPDAARLVSAATTPSGTVYRGDYFFRRNPSAEDIAMQVVTTGGTIGSGAVTGNIYSFPDGVKPTKSKLVTITVTDGAAAGTFTLPSGAYASRIQVETVSDIPGTPTNVNIKLGSSAGGSQYVADTDVKTQGVVDLTLLYAARNPATTVHYTVTQSGGTPADQDGTLKLRVFYE